MKFQHWQDEIRSRQRNISPPDVIRNDAFVEDSLIRGGKRLSLLQRVGAVILGISFFSVGALTIYYGVWGLLQPAGLDLKVLVPFGMLVGGGFVYIGARMLYNGCLSR